ncbi:MAG: hypothetical protein HYV97_14825 [Bdellovibrio sp.]|nr:hypothetical protein [Bdellovibrio sp.]
MKKSTKTKTPRDGKNILATVAEKLFESTAAVETVTTNISLVSQQLSRSTTEQAAAIAETAASTEEMTAMVAQTAQNANNSLKLCEEGQRQAKNGKDVIAKMITAMNDIHASNAKLESITKIIDDIRTKTKVINDIVFETRLLSFNASIEAARAGIHGKGFAVVAEEVGKLAAISGKAAGEIRALLESSSTEVNQVVRMTQERVGVAKTVSEECESSFSGMTESLDRIADAMHQITTATGEQEKGIRETNRAIMDMDQVTQHNSAASEEVASQSVVLRGEVDNFSHWVNTLKNTIDGKTSKIDIASVPKVRTVAPIKTPVPSAQVAEITPAPVVSNATSVVKRDDSRWKKGA